MFALFPQCGDTSGASLGVRSVALLHLRKVLFSILEFLGSSLVRLWLFVGLLHETEREGTREGNLKKKHFLRKRRWCRLEGEVMVAWLR